MFKFSPKLPEGFLDEPQPFMIDDVIFEVVAKIRAVKNAGTDDEQVIETLAGPIQLTVTPSLYRALFVMATTCSVPEYMIDMEELLPAARGIVADIEHGDYKWEKSDVTK